MTAAVRRGLLEVIGRDATSRSRGSSGITAGDQHHPASSRATAVEAQAGDDVPFAALFQPDPPRVQQQTVQQLCTAGFEVEVSVNTTAWDREEAKQRRAAEPRSAAIEWARQSTRRSN